MTLLSLNSINNIIIIREFVIKAYPLPIFTMNQPSQQYINHLIEITLRFIRTKQLKILDEHLAENSNDPNSVCSQIGVNFFGASFENDSHSIKVYWFTDVLG